MKSSALTGGTSPFLLHRLKHDTILQTFPSSSSTVRVRSHSRGIASAVEQEASGKTEMSVVSMTSHPKSSVALGERPEPTWIIQHFDTGHVI